MRYLAVLVVSLAVGALAYVRSLRSPEEPAAIGFAPAEPAEPHDAPPDPPPGYTYLRVPVTRGPSLGERLQGLLGSLALVAMGAVALALSLWAVGTLIGRTIRSYLRP